MEQHRKEILDIILKMADREDTYIGKTLVHTKNNIAHGERNVRILIDKCYNIFGHEVKSKRRYTDFLIQYVTCRFCDYSINLERRYNQDPVTLQYNIYYELIFDTSDISQSILITQEEFYSIYDVVKLKEMDYLTFSINDLKTRMGL